MTPDCTLVIRTPAELIAIVPFLLGYHPRDSLAVVGLVGERVEFTVCHDLPPPDWTDPEAKGAAATVADAVARQRSRAVVIIGYGSLNRVTPAALRCAQAVQTRQIDVLDVLRVADGRWWSFLCAGRQCCPPEGTPCLPADSVIAAEATFRGQVALPSRQELTAQVAAVGGAERAEMRRATERARRRFTDLLADDLTAERYGRLVKQAGQAALRLAEKRYRTGGTLSPDETAWLGVLLVDRSVEDYALDRADTQEWRIRLWTDVLRRVEPAYVAPPACLLGYTAWQAGRGALARVAVDRALAEEPQHQLAALLHNVLGHGLAPHMVRPSRKLRRAG
ncbi:DUF4192 domain-containing protein [Actinoplanes teichomyceticus]|uniref:Uncharacterized protein DUF4192 n=1 Tax=Actinoplanes teichomyceticus TaxID=1867 RepID=A0A561WRA5_ACTTI|nr:DUF4192 domain-containing protein [Actinoplanes teichomyceticus]TWG26392.1 uncharacterized protein DUF4192 [Actinoplanes teichomyceticus]GIF11469.1 hypothetical protein Ate01nite_15010 [Actinoplanes teichomyceticus]